MSTKLDPNFVEHIQMCHSQAKFGIDALISEVERLESLSQRYEEGLMHIVNCVKKDKSRGDPYEEELADHLAEIARRALKN